MHVKFTTGRPAPVLALELRDALMSCRDLGADFDAAAAVAAARDLYWLFLAAAAVSCRQASAARPTPPAPAAAPRRQLVASESTPGLFYIVSRSACSCPGFRFRRDCKHVRREREQWAARVRSILAARIAVAA